MKPSETDNKRIARLHAAILVARSLVRARLSGDKPGLDHIETRARYGHLLAVRGKLVPEDAHRIALAAWLSAMADQPQIQAKMAEENGVVDLLDETGASPACRILNLVRRFQQAQAEDARIGKDMVVTAALLERQGGDSAEDKLLVRRFVKLLKDESFLDVEQRGVGRILIVDPDEDISPTLAPPLRARGCDVRVAANVDRAKQHMAEALPDTVVAHARLPIVSGLDFCRDLKSDPQTARIPFIVLFDRRQAQSEKRALHAGADEVFAKPVDLETFCIKLDRLMTVARDTRVAAEAEAGLGGVSGPLEDMPFTDMIQVLVAGGKTMRILLCREAEAGEVVVADGEVVHAQLDETTGPDAFYRFMRWREGTFAIAHCPAAPPERTVRVPVMSLLMEGARLMDEAQEA